MPKRCRSSTRRFQSLPELSPSVRLRDDCYEWPGQEQTDVSPQRLPNALRKAEDAGWLGEVFEGRDYRGDAATAGNGDERHGSGAANAENQTGVAVPLPGIGRSMRCGNDGSVESVESPTQASPLSTSPLGISPTPGQIPTFPQRRRRRRMEKGKTKSRFPTFPPPRLLSYQYKRSKAEAASPSSRGLVVNHKTMKGAGPKHFRRHRITLLFQAHRQLESIGLFRLVPRWN
jgi:hypothetical protein